MALQLTSTAGLLVVSMVLSWAVVAGLTQQRHKSGGPAILVSAAMVALWATGQTLLLLGGGESIAVAGLYATSVGLAFIGPSWTVFALQYTGRSERITRRLIGLLLVESAVFLALLATNGLHNLLYTTPTLTTVGGTETLVFERGLFHWLHYGYVYLLLLYADSLLCKKFLASRNVYRKRSFLLMSMSIALLLGHVISVAGFSPFPYTSLGPILFVYFAVMSLLAMTSDRFLSLLPVERLLALFSSRSKTLAPVARDTVIEEMGSGVLVIDHKNRIVDINPMGKRILGRADGRVVGKQVTEVLQPEIFVAEETPFLEPDVYDEEYTGLWVETGDTRHCFDVTITGLESDSGEISGRVGIIHDVTDRERRKQKLEERTAELERQNEQLENFAGIVSHDLRNPLNVAKGSVTLAKKKGGDEYFEKIRQAHDRMEALIEDVLTLARQGRTVDETTVIAVARVATDAWENVQASEATLAVDVDLTVEADRGRLLQVFENLFRNAVEHGREDVTITVGELPDGFYVADDGPGIPPDQRDDVLEQGFTTSESGTGFGLSIAATVVEAHGWDIAVTESESGGAQFEITGVTSVAKPELQANQRL